MGKRKVLRLTVSFMDKWCWRLTFLHFTSDFASNKPVDVTLSWCLLTDLTLKDLKMEQMSKNGLFPVLPSLCIFEFKFRSGFLFSEAFVPTTKRRVG